MHLTFSPPASAPQPFIKELKAQAERETTIAEAVRIAEQERQQPTIDRFVRIASQLVAELDQMRITHSDNEQSDDD